jgi:hypothetical protein
VFPMRYEHHLHINNKAIPVRGRGGPYVFPVGYKHHLHVNSKAIPVSVRGGSCVFCEVRTSTTYKKVKLSTQQAVEAHRTVRRPCFQPIYRIGLQMAVRLASRTDRALLTDFFFFYFCLRSQVEEPPGPNVARNVMYIDKTEVRHRVSSPQPSDLWHSASNTTQ